MWMQYSYFYALLGHNVLLLDLHWLGKEGTEKTGERPGSREQQ